MKLYLCGPARFDRTLGDIRMPLVLEARSDSETRSLDLATIRFTAHLEPSYPEGYPDANRAAASLFFGRQKPLEFGRKLAERYGFTVGY